VPIIRLWAHLHVWPAHGDSHAHREGQAALRGEEILLLRHVLHLLRRLPTLLLRMLHVILLLRVPVWGLLRFPARCAAPPAAPVLRLITIKARLLQSNSYDETHICTLSLSVYPCMPPQSCG